VYSSAVVLIMVASNAWSSAVPPFWFAIGVTSCVFSPGLQMG
jgi:hypothetical protein